jgi:hypothetical protein
MLRNVKVLLIALVLIVIAGSVVRLRRGNTVPDSAAGYKANVVPGYTVTNIVYDLNADKPCRRRSKSPSNVTPTSGSEVAKTVKLQTADGAPGTDCTLVAGTAPIRDVTCTYGSLALADVTALTWSQQHHRSRAVNSGEGARPVGYED